MVVVCLFLNFVPMCKFFEQQFLCNTNLLHCVTLLSMCVFQRLRRVEWGVISSSLNNYFSPCFRFNQLCAFPSSTPVVQNYSPLIALNEWDMQTHWHTFLLCLYRSHTFHPALAGCPSHLKNCSPAPTTASSSKQSSFCQANWNDQVSWIPVTQLHVDSHVI